MDENGELRQTLARIEQNQAEISHEVIRLRADIAILTSRQNSKIADTKKKPTGSPGSFKHSRVVS